LTASKSETIFERFTDDRHFDIFPGDPDETLCQEIQNSRGKDFRQDLFFGFSLDRTDHIVVLKYGNRRKKPIICWPVKKNRLFGPDARLLAILAKHKRREPLSASDRQYKHRTIEKIRRKMAI
jgi:hypothetical protein